MFLEKGVRLFCKWLEKLEEGKILVSSAFCVPLFSIPDFLDNLPPVSCVEETVIRIL